MHCLIAIIPFQTYKKQYVVLRRNVGEGTKVVEIMSNEQSDNSEDIEFLPLTGTWNVQDKSSQNKKRYAFEVCSKAPLITPPTFLWSTGSLRNAPHFFPNYG